MTDTNTGESATPSRHDESRVPPTSLTSTPTPSPDVQHHLAALRAVHQELSRVADALHHEADTAYHGLDSARQGVARAAHHAGADFQAHCPAWLRPTAGENRWPVAAAILVAIALQVALPDRLSLLNRWLLPMLELALLIALLIAVPRRFEKRSRPLRVASLTLTALLSVANAWSAALLVIGLVAGTEGESAGPLLSAGAAIWLTNVIAFALWYWQFDRGGPAARAHAVHTLPDFQFAQMQTPQMAHPDWEPGFVDYLYLSFTNATAFSPTDVLPLSRWAKLTMLAQSLVSLVTVALVIARAVNILK
ncbi:MAG: DUF1345 domain-containing protein [Pseudonocardia sp.]|nr:DUF1345 domain-containing protein [Pseudonocardia sp.]